MDFSNMSEVLLLSGLLISLLFISAYLANRIKAPDIIIFLLIGIGLAFFVSHSEILAFAAEVGIVLMFSCSVWNSLSINSKTRIKYLQSWIIRPLLIIRRDCCFTPFHETTY